MTLKIDRRRNCRTNGDAMDMVEENLKAAMLYAQQKDLADVQQKEQAYAQQKAQAYAQQKAQAGIRQQAQCGQGIGSIRPSLCEEAETQAGHHRNEAERQNRAAAFFREHPEFDEFIQLIRNGTIGI